MNELEIRIETKLKKTFSGNNFSNSDFSHLQSIRDQYTVRYTVRWSFGYEWSYKDYNGNAKANHHFGGSEADFNRHYNKITNQAQNDQNLRTNFINGLVGQKQEGLNFANKKNYYHDFGTSAYYYNCSSCHGNGENSCIHCYGNGRRTCQQCNGTSYVTINNGGQMQRHSCNTCFGGRVSCIQCSGTGNVSCSSCAGHGFFTRVYQVHAVATPSNVVSSNKGLHHQDLINHLANRGAANSKTILPFTLENSFLNQADEWEFHYDSQAKVMQFDFRIRKKSFSTVLLENNLYEFLKPAVFDHLFTDHITHLATYAENKRPLPRAQAKKHFDNFRNLSAMDHAMQNIAQTNIQGADNYQRQIINSCDGYISHQGSLLLSNALLVSLDEVAPTYSKLLWRVFSTIVLASVFGFYAFLELSVHGVISLSSDWVGDFRFTNRMPHLTDYDLYYNSPVTTGNINLAQMFAQNNDIYSQYWTFIISTTFDVLILGTLVAIISVILVYFKRRNIPQEYWRKMTNFKQLWKLMLRTYLFSLLGVFAGYLIVLFGLWHTANIVHPLMYGYFFLHNLSASVIHQIGML